MLEIKKELCLFPLKLYFGFVTSLAYAIRCFSLLESFIAIRRCIFSLVPKKYIFFGFSFFMSKFFRFLNLANIIIIHPHPKPRKKMWTCTLSLTHGFEPLKSIKNQSILPFKMLIQHVLGNS